MVDMCLVFKCVLQYKAILCFMWENMVIFVEITSLHIIHLINFFNQVTILIMYEYKERRFSQILLIFK